MSNFSTTPPIDWYITTEYHVFIIDPAPEDAARELNELALRGWKLVGVAHQDRAIMAKELVTYIRERGAELDRQPKA